MVSALFLLVVLTALGAALASISLRQHLGSAAELETARALQAARAGVEWGAFSVLQASSPSLGAPACFATSSFAVAAFAGFTVTVECTRTPASGTLSDGATALVFYQLVATACNAPSAGACPSTLAAPDASYVERQIAWTVMR